MLRSNDGIEENIKRRDPGNISSNFDTVVLESEGIRTREHENTTVLLGSVLRKFCSRIERNMILALRQL